MFLHKKKNYRPLCINVGKILSIYYNQKFFLNRYNFTSIQLKNRPSKHNPTSANIIETKCHIPIHRLVTKQLHNTHQSAETRSSRVPNHFRNLDRHNDQTHYKNCNKNANVSKIPAESHSTVKVHNFKRGRTKNSATENRCEPTKRG